MRAHLGPVSAPAFPPLALPAGRGANLCHHVAQLVLSRRAEELSREVTALSQEVRIMRETLQGGGGEVVQAVRPDPRVWPSDPRA